MKNTLIIIAHSDNCGTPEINTFHTNSKAVQHLGEIVEEEYDVKPDVDQDFKEYFLQYYTWVNDENDNCCKVTIDYEIVEH